jgi:hypothetical protein
MCRQSLEQCALGSRGYERHYGGRTVQLRHRGFDESRGCLTFAVDHRLTENEWIETRAGWSVLRSKAYAWSKKRRNLQSWSSAARSFAERRGAHARDGQSGDPSRPARLDSPRGPCPSERRQDAFEQSLPWRHSPASRRSSLSQSLAIGPDAIQKGWSMLDNTGHAKRSRQQLRQHRAREMSQVS